jgi:beta-glucanase (GH16 family)
MPTSRSSFRRRAPKLARYVATVIAACLVLAACTPPEASTGAPPPSTDLELLRKPPKTTLPPATTRPATTTTVPATTLPPTTTTAPPTTTTTAPPRTYAFVDEFNAAAGSRPDPAKWWVNPWCENDPNYMNMCQNPANATFDGNGNLVLRVTAGTMGRPYDGAQINTFQRGAWPPTKVFASVAPPVHIEARIKLPTGAGLWPSFWPESVDPKFIELDIMESQMAHFEQHGYHVHGLVEYNNGYATGQDLRADFHVYWADYYPDRITFGFDDITLDTVAFPSSAPKVGMVLGNAVGLPGTWGGDGGPPPASALPADMLVDYVRAWAI